MSPPPPAAAAPEFRQLLPEPGTVTVDEALGGLNPVAHAHRDRPHTLVNFVTSVDGRAAFQGRSAPLSDPGDRAMFHGLRERVDAVMAGTATMRTERYGRMARDPERRRRRQERGLTPEPLAVIVTRSGDVPFDIPLFGEPEARVVIFTPTELDTSTYAAQVEVVRLDPGQMTMTTAWRRLTSDFGVRTLLCEGGPHLNGQLLLAGLVDELFLSFSPKLAGGEDATGEALRIVAGAQFAEPLELELLSALESASTLFLRYGVRASAPERVSRETMPSSSLAS